MAASGEFLMAVDTIRLGPLDDHSEVVRVKSLVRVVNPGNRGGPDLLPLSALSTSGDGDAPPGDPCPGFVVDVGRYWQMVYESGRLCAERPVGGGILITARA